MLLITENPHIPKRELAELIGISTTAIDKNIKTLKIKKSCGGWGRIMAVSGEYWMAIMNKGTVDNAGERLQ